MIEKIKIKEIRTGCTDPYEHGLIRIPENGMIGLTEKLNEVIDEINSINKKIDLIIQNIVE